MILFYTESYKYLADKLKMKKGLLERKYFDDVGGEFLLTFKNRKEDIKGQDIYILGGTIDDKDTFELLDLGTAASMLGAKSINWIIPYYGNARQDKACEDGEIVKGKTRARYFSYVPKANEGNRVYLLDLHAEGIVHYFENGLHSIHMYGKDSVFEALDLIKEQEGHDSKIVLASTDEGRCKWVTSLARDCKLDVALALKRRDEMNIESIAVNADVKNKIVVIYDDMLCSGNTLIQSAKTYKDCGAKKIFFIGTHGPVLSSSVFKEDIML